MGGGETKLKPSWTKLEVKLTVTFRLKCRSLLNTGEVFKCEHCSYRSSSRSAFTHHLFSCRSVPNEARLYRCLICRLSFPSKQQVIHHIFRFFFTSFIVIFSFSLFLFSSTPAVNVLVFLSIGTRTCKINIDKINICLKDKAN